uniref:DUF4216 domain-containing protein n=1 Tax=Tanacetum cinerariifolium TaxID=118510 RepID=A0A6L2M4I7_TANCI|nr:hypothetical protein [Tanacetum cinerariifolium]
MTPILVNSCVVNDVRFVVHSRDEHHTTQNSSTSSLSEKDIEINEGQKVKRFVIRNNITQIWACSESFKDKPYILATQVKQVFYLEDMAKRPLYWKSSSDLALSGDCNDLDFATSNIDQSMKVKAPPDIILVDKEDDFIDNEYDVSRDLADSDDEVLANANDYDEVTTVVYSSDEKD